MSEESPIVEEVRARAMKISERFGHDLQRYCSYLREQERKHPHRVVSQITVVRAAEPVGPSGQ
jgi:hypothetical protein